MTAWNESAVYQSAIIKYTNPFMIINKENMDLMNGEEYYVLIAYRKFKDIKQEDPYEIEKVQSLYSLILKRI